MHATMVSLVTTDLLCLVMPLHLLSQVPRKVGERKRDRAHKATQHHQENNLGTLTVINIPIVVHIIPTRTLHHCVLQEQT